MSLLSLIVAAFVATASAQEMVVQSNGDVVGATLSVGGTCASKKTCVVFQNDNPNSYPVEVVSVSYASRVGRITIASPVVLEGGRLQCVRPDDGRACAPVLAPGQMGALELPAPPAPGQLITVHLRAWDMPGSELDTSRTEIVLGGLPVTLLGDPVAAMQTPAVQEGVVSMTIGEASNFANWRKGS